MQDFYHQQEDLFPTIFEPEAVGNWAPFGLQELYGSLSQHPHNYPLRDSKYVRIHIYIYIYMHIYIYIYRHV